MQSLTSGNRVYENKCNHEPFTKCTVEVVKNLAHLISFNDCKHLDLLIVRKI